MLKIDEDQKQNHQKQIYAGLLCIYIFLQLA